MLRFHLFLLLVLGGCTSVSVEASAQYVFDDTASDFLGTGVMELGAVVTTYDGIAPVAYYTGGLLARASDDRAFSIAEQATWTTLDTVSATSGLAVMPSLDRFWGNGVTPAGLGLTSSALWTQWYEGEIYLDAGTWSFELLSDDSGFVEIAAPGTREFVRVVGADWPNAAIGLFAAGAAGWHPIRVATTNGEGAAGLRLTYAVGGGAPQPIPGHALRFRADAIQGWAMAGWDVQSGAGGYEMRMDRVAPANQAWGIRAPEDLGITNGDYFAVRWAGQIRIATAGDYAFTLRTDDGHRLWIDGVQYANLWERTVQETTTSPIPLAKGWHDMVVEHTEAEGSAGIELLVSSGPELAGSALPQSQMRPVIARGPRFAARTNTTPRAIPDAGQAFSDIVLDAPPGATASYIDLQWRINHAQWADLDVRLVAPDGTQVRLWNRQANTGDLGYQNQLVEQLRGKPVAGVWRLLAIDAVATNIGSIVSFQITVHHLDERPVVPPTSAFESGIQDLRARASLIDGVQWNGAFPAGSSMQMRIRTGDTEEDCLAQPWSEPILTTGPLADRVAARRYLQYRLEFSSNGVASPWVDWVQVGYTTTAE